MSVFQIWMASSGLWAPVLPATTQPLPMTWISESVSAEVMAAPSIVFFHIVPSLVPALASIDSAVLSLIVLKATTLRSLVSGAQLL